MSDRPARLLLVHRYYHPDAPPYATMLRVIAQRLAADGHDVHVLSSTPTYNETSATIGAPSREVDHQVHVHRLRLPTESKDRPVQRALIAALFLVGVAVEIVRLRPDLVTFSTMPPVGLGVVVRGALALVGRRGRYLYHCQDLYPEVLTVTGRRGPSRIAQLAARIELSTRRHARTVVVLSDDMRRTIVAGGTTAENVQVLNNFPLTATSASRPPGRGRTPRVVFAGNMGRFQQMDVLAEAIRRVRESVVPVEFVLVGTGVARHHLEALAGPDVELRDHVPAEEAFTILLGCDVGVVTIEPGMLQVAYPSKTMTYLDAGCLVVATADPDTALASELAAAGVGIAVPPSDPDALAAGILAAVARAGDDTAKRCRTVASERFGRDRTLDAWSLLVTDLVGGGRDG